MTGHSEKKIIVLTSPRHARIIQMIFEPLEASPEIIYEIHSVMDCFVKDWYHGLLVDSAYIKHMPDSEKPMMEKYLNFITSGQFTVDPAQGSAIFHSKNDDVVTLEEFVAICIKAGPRKFRSEPRLPIHLNVVISRKKRRLKERAAFRSFTHNLSLSGCFAYANEEYEIGSLLLLEFVELVDKTPIVAKVRYQLKWGTLFNVPGIGLEFMNLTEKQKTELKYHASQI